MELKSKINKFQGKIENPIGAGENKVLKLEYEIYPLTENERLKIQKSIDKKEKYLWNLKKILKDNFYGEMNEKLISKLLNYIENPASSENLYIDENIDEDMGKWALYMALNFLIPVVPTVLYVNLPGIPEDPLITFAIAAGVYMVLSFITAGILKSFYLNSNRNELRNTIEGKFRILNENYTKDSNYNPSQNKLEDDGELSDIRLTTKEDLSLDNLLSNFNLES